MIPLSSVLRGRIAPAGYVSFLSALVHHGAIVDTPAVVQVASAERTGRLRGTQPGPVDFLLVPRDLFFGFCLEPFEGDVVPVATPEKALLDWVHWAETHGIDPRLDEIEWDAIDRRVLAILRTDTGIDERPLLPSAGALARSVHDQARLRLEAIEGGGGLDTSGRPPLGIAP